MLKKITIFLFSLLLLTGCIRKEYSFKVKNDVILLNQSNEEFDISMLEPYISLYYGESEESLSENAKYEGEIDLSTVGVYNITLIASHKNRAAFLEVHIDVVDVIPPEFFVFEKELLVYQDEDIEINSENFFINLVDTFQGLISNRIHAEGEYNLKTIKTYPIELLGTDSSGNAATYPINVRVTDIIDEKAQYLYEKATLAANGQTFVFNNNDKSSYILNSENALAVFTPNYREHFYWLSGVTGEYNNKQSGVKLSISDGLMYADYSLANKTNNYERTKLEIQYETDNYRHYLARATYLEAGKEIEKLSKFVIRKIDGVWLVDEFYIPY